MFYIVIRKNLTARPDWPPGILDAHLTWANTEEKNGRLLVSGPTPEGGIYLIRAQHRNEADTVTRDDPAIASGCSSYALHEWDIKRGLGLFS